MKSKLLIAAFALAVISSFAFITRSNQTKTEPNNVPEETKPNQGFVLEDNINW